jgi:histone H3/H4
MPRSKKDRIIPVAPVDRLMRRFLSSKVDRVSDKGAERLSQILEEVGEYLSKIAVELTEYTGRKTITDKDVDLAYKQWRRSL